MHVYESIFAAGVALAIGLTAPAAGQEAESPEAETGEFDSLVRGDRSWSIQGRPLVWFPAMSGDAQFGGAAANTSLSVSRDLGLDDNEPTFLGEFIWRRDRWMVLVEAFDFDTESTGPARATFTVNGTPVSAGTPLTHDFGMTSVSAHLGYDFFGDLLEPDPTDPQDMRADLHLSGLIGGRAVGLDQRFAAAGGPTVSFDEWAGAIEAGLRLDLFVDPEWDGGGVWDVAVTVLGGVGEYDSVETATLGVTFSMTYMPAENIGITFGYRQLDLIIERDEPGSNYEFDGRLAGLFVGATVRF
ncbi:MAG: hypothetical protein ACF8PN_05970 [Phycisphaerales bacterium]